jgi:hypothetical protein
VLARGSLTIVCVRRQPGQPARARDIPPEIDARFAVDPTLAVPGTAAATS